MKRLLLTKMAALLMCLALFSQCTSIRSVSIDTLRPAQITFPSYVNTLLLVDRTRFQRRSTEFIEGALTGELPGEDRAALQEAMSSLQGTLLLSPRFKVAMATEVLPGNSLTTAFPDALPWYTINELCDKYHTEAIVSFEIFDTDFFLTDGKRKVKKQIKDDKGVSREIEVEEYFVKGTGRVKMGIRLYDPKAMSIVDQQLFTQTNDWEATGVSKAEAFERLIARPDATRRISAAAASSYAYKIAPMPVRLVRDFYAKSKHTPAIAAGARQADVNNWNDALKTWLAAWANAKDKEAGKLCYNIAVAYEVLGDLNSARDWASRGYVSYNNKKARSYCNMLDSRKADEAKVDEQMK